jgi:CDP-4-dehydro-6-deoxyglucose reductase, E1
MDESSLTEKQKISEILDLVRDVINSRESNWVPGKDWVYYAGPYFDSEEYTNTVKTLLGGWLVLGAKGTEFEKKFSTFYEKDHGILTNSGSSANLLMMAAMASKRLYNLPKGTKVITPIAGFPTTLNPIIQVGFEPVFVDIEIDTLNMDIDQIDAACTRDPEIKIITFAHVLGNPPNMDKLMAVIKKHNLILLEDCCDALGSTYKGKPLGSFGEMASCSFYPAHHITMGEGGFVAVNNKQQEKVVRSFRDWGRGCWCVGKKASTSKKGVCGKRFSCWLKDLPEEIFDHKYIYEEIGYNVKPIEMQAAMGLAQIEKIDEISSKRKRNYSLLYDIFEKYEDYFHLPRPTKHSDPSWFAFPLTIRNGVPFKRSDITSFYESNKIQTRTYFAGNILLQPAYRHLMDAKKVIEDYPVARKVTTDTFFLGTSPVITDEQVEYIKRKTDEFMDSFTEKLK